MQVPEVSQETVMLVASAIFLVTYALFVSEKMRRVVAGLLGAACMVVAGSLLWIETSEDAASHPFYPVDQAFWAIDFNTIGLLLGMMIIVGVLSTTGLFQALAVWVAKAAKGDHWKLIVLFSAVTAFLSAFLDNVTTVLLMVPVTISMAKKLHLDPVPFIITGVLASNVGGTATLIGDPPNIIIGSEGGLPFLAFITHLAPMMIIVFAVGMLYVKWRFREEMAVEPRHVKKVMRMDPLKEITDLTRLRIGLSMLGIVVLFFCLQDVIGVQVGLIALVGAGILLLISGANVESILVKHVDWETLLFFAGLFIIVGGLVHAGIMESVAEGTVSITGGNLVLIIIIVIWLSAFASAFVGAIPIAVSMGPIIMNISTTDALSGAIGHYAYNPILWALAIGACLGGNGTLVGAPANLVATGLCGKAGRAITFKEYIKVGMPYMLITTFVGMVCLLAFMQVPGF